MKKSFLMIFCFVAIFAFSQEYHFDYFIKEKFVGGKPQKAEWFNEWLVNSTTGSELFFKNYNNKTIAVIYLESEKIKHVFKVNKVKDNISFTYKHSQKIVNEFQPKKGYRGKKVIKIKKIDSLNYNVVVFKNSRLKKKEIDAVINFEKADFEYINFKGDHIIADNVENELRKLLDPKFKFIIKSMNYGHSSGVTFSRSIDNIQKINLVLKVPSQLIFNKADYWSDFE